MCWIGISQAGVRKRTGSVRKRTLHRLPENDEDWIGNPGVLDHFPALGASNLEPTVVVFGAEQSVALDSFLLRLETNRYFALSIDYLYSRT